MKYEILLDGRWTTVTSGTPDNGALNYLRPFETGVHTEAINDGSGFIKGRVERGHWRKVKE